MVLYYGLLALETANNTIAAASSPGSSSTGIAMSSLISNRMNLLAKHANKRGIPSSSSNSWIYTEDLRKRFEERYADYRYVFVPVYVDRKGNRHSHSTTAIPRQKTEMENSWIYSRSLRDHLFNSTSKMSLPIQTNISSSNVSVTNHGFARDELPMKKSLKNKFFRRSASVKEKSTKTSSFSSLPSTSSFTIPTTTTATNLVRHRTSDVVEEEDDEGINDAEENHSIPLIKQNSTFPATSRTTTVSSPETKPIVPSTTHSILTSSSPTKSTRKHSTTSNNKLTRLRSFFFKSSSSRSQQQQQQVETTSSNRISRT